MNTKTLLNKRIFSLFVIFASFALAGTLYSASIFDITYPIPELGNCENGAACKAYCDIPENERACEAFAEKFGIGKAGERKEHIAELMENGGPGNCARNAKDPEATCRAYCDEQTHMRECVAYGKEHGILAGEELREAEKVIKALDGGAKLPAGCTNKNSCKETCENPKDIDTARACFLFAEQAGLLPPGVDRERAEKMFRLIAEGKAPFKSIKDFKQCENPADEDIFQKCVGFAAENGLMSPEEVEMVKKTGGKGPGGCIGKVQCEAYCEAHQEECFQFAQEHGLLRPEDEARMREGAEMLKQGLEQAPPAVRECISQAIGDGVLQEILSGQKMPSPKLGNAMRTCFERAFGGEGERGMMRGPDGDGGMRGGGEGERPSGGYSGEGGFPGRGGNGGFPPPSQANFPPEVKACIVSKIGEDGFTKIVRGGGSIDRTIGEVIGGCFRQSEGPRTGPGGCNTPEECKAFCSDPANAQVCNIPAGNPGGGMDGGMHSPAGFQPGTMMPGSGYPPPQGYPGTYPPPQGGYPLPEQSPPPPTSFISGIKNMASVISSFFRREK